MPPKKGAAKGGKKGKGGKKSGSSKGPTIIGKDFKNNSLFKTLV